MATFEERARARAGWPIRTVRLGAERLVDERDTTTAAERVRLVHRLTCEAWRAAGLEWPTYARGEMPGRILRRSP